MQFILESLKLISWGEKNPVTKAHLLFVNKQTNQKVLYYVFNSADGIVRYLSKHVINQSCVDLFVTILTALQESECTYSILLDCG